MMGEEGSRVATRRAPKARGHKDVAKGFPPAGDLPVVEGLPDPFELNDGTRVRSRRDWAARREQIKAMMLHYQYGRMPTSTEKATVSETSSRPVYAGAATEKRITLTTGRSHAIRIQLDMLVPNGRGSFPVILRNDRDLGQTAIAQEIVERGYILAEYNRHDLDFDGPDRSDGVHPVYPEFDWGTLAAWAWGGMRVVDYLLTLDTVDHARIAFTGHSRGGKTALLAGALDERIALAAPNGSGTGGAGSYRILGEGAERLEDILRNFHYWFHPRLAGFVGRENRLPFDQHFLRALVAPRAVISTEALEDHWANPLGTQHMFGAAQPVFDWLGVGGRNAIHFRQGGHAQGPEDIRALLDYADWVFFRRAPKSGRKFDLLPFPKEEFSWAIPPAR